ncbi:unannotated protein [freshwater metagenome]|uniref:Unannotated protein n=1 Tax=freshwater metagenome TaxID=449393 RepID=A0A6J6QP54_9ZZZZ
MTDGPAVQYRVSFGKKDEAVEGPDDATLVISIPAAEASSDPAVAFMSGRLKAEGHTGMLFEVLKSGAAADAIRRIATR